MSQNFAFCCHILENCCTILKDIWRNTHCQDDRLSRFLKISRKVQKISFCQKWKLIFKSVGNLDQFSVKIGRTVSLQLMKLKLIGNSIFGLNEYSKIPLIYGKWFNYKNSWLESWLALFRTYSVFTYTILNALTKFIRLFERYPLKIALTM